MNTITYFVRASANWFRQLSQLPKPHLSCLIEQKRIPYLQPLESDHHLIDILVPKPTDADYDKNGLNT